MHRKCVKMIQWCEQSKSILWKGFSFINICEQTDSGSSLEQHRHHFMYNTLLKVPKLAQDGLLVFAGLSLVFWKDCQNPSKTADTSKPVFQHNMIRNTTSYLIGVNLLAKM